MVIFSGRLSVIDDGLCDINTCFVFKYGQNSLEMTYGASDKTLLANFCEKSKNYIITNPKTCLAGVIYIFRFLK